MMQWSSLAIQCDLVSDGFGVSHGLMGGRELSGVCRSSMMSFVSIYVRGSEVSCLHSQSKGEESGGAASLKRSCASSMAVMLLRLLVNFIVVIELRVIVGGDREGGHFSQWGTYLTPSSCAASFLDSSLSGSIVAGGMETLDVAEANALGVSLGWT
jgi:hypothetical protein